ncbi:MAG TPA: aldo/keto reductase [Candidatus Dormibacteraeota bacterium]|nr:aldo/keto reductase [Candidatus Dormibacteraeota bacterium]
MKFGDLEIARVGLGSNRLTHTPEHVAFIRAAVEAGVQMIDTAHLYTGTQSEKTIGEAVGGAPKGVVVATKGGFNAGEGKPDVLRAQIEESLRNLRTEAIMLYFLHRVHPDTPLEASLGVIKEQMDRKKIRFAGVSEVDVHQIERARKVVPIHAVQNHYNLAERKWDAVVDYCEREGIVFVPFFPLRAGHSAGVDELARKHRATPSQVMLAWLLQRSPVMLPIPGTLSLEHLKENLAAEKLELTKAEYESLA